MRSFAHKSATSTTYHGLIAQEVERVAPELVVTDASTSLKSVKYGDIQWLIVQALQELIARVNDLANTVAGLVEKFTTKELSFTRATGTELTVQQLNTEGLCADKSDGTSVCVSGDQLAAFLAQAGGSGTPGPTSLSALPDISSSVGTTSAGSSTPTVAASRAQPPVIQINGANPAVIQVGDTYNDLGARIVSPEGDKNLAIRTFLNGRLVSNIVIDTTQVATDTIDYLVTDRSGIAVTSTRVIVIAPAVGGRPLLPASTTPPIDTATD